MTVSAVLYSAGGVAHQRPCPASTLDGHRNKRLRYPADPPTVQEILAMMREAGTDRHDARPRALTCKLRRGVPAPDE